MPLCTCAMALVHAHTWLYSSLSLVVLAVASNTHNVNCRLPVHSTINLLSPLIHFWRIFSATLSSPIFRRARTTSTHDALGVHFSHRSSVCSICCSLWWKSRWILFSSYISRPRLSPSWHQSLTDFNSEKRFPAFNFGSSGSAVVLGFTSLARARKFNHWVNFHSAIKITKPTITVVRTLISSQKVLWSLDSILIPVANASTRTYKPLSYLRVRTKYYEREV